MDLQNMPIELKERLAECNSAEEALEVIKEEGRELLGDQLAMVAGGTAWDEHKCPQCGSVNTKFDNDLLDQRKDERNTVFRCHDCGYTWEVPIFPELAGGE